jgi:hypothetical protein
MNVKSDKLNCYIEGIRIPISNFKIEYRRNTLPTAMVTIAIGEQIVPKSWAMALVQITYIADSKEHLLFDGVCYTLDIDEQTGYMIVSLISKWEVLNLNSALDYTSPKKYGLQNIDEGVMIYLGNEESVEITTTQTEGGLLSNRYYFLKESSRDIFDMDPNDSETHKLEYIINRVPFAERFARIFFDDIIMQNFTLSQAHVERLNLLNKVGETTKRTTVMEQSAADTLRETLQYQIVIDPSRTSLYWDQTKGEVVDNFVEDPIQSSGDSGASQGEAPACRGALNDANARWPNRNKANDGIIGDASHQARKSDHNQGNAVDITHDPVSGCTGDIIAAAALKDPRTKYVIWNRQIAFTAKGGQWTNYQGPNPHTKHCHISILSSARDNTSKWGF